MKRTLTVIIATCLSAILWQKSVSAQSKEDVNTYLLELYKNGLSIEVYDGRLKQQTSKPELFKEVYEKLKPIYHYLATNLKDYESLDLLVKESQTLMIGLVEDEFHVENENYIDPEYNVKYQKLIIIFRTIYQQLNNKINQEIITETKESLNKLYKDLGRKINGFDSIIDRKIIPVSNKLTDLDTSLFNVRDITLKYIERRLDTIENYLKYNPFLYLGLGLSIDEFSVSLPQLRLITPIKNTEELDFSFSFSPFFTPSADEEFGITASGGIRYCKKFGIELGASRLNNSRWDWSIRSYLNLDNNWLFGADYDGFKGLGFSLFYRLPKSVN